ncbi:2TM domain-containing protein [Algibacter amylolyticus]|nr:2TM domain-containing protein [Algibacter amylolyticus]MBB5269456.1 putative integral membrane protein [Algibacter amylolyticus]
MGITTPIIHNAMQNANIEPFTKNNHDKEQAYIRAKKRVKALKGFYWHAFWYILVNIFLIAMIAINSSSAQFWQFGTFSTAFFWGIGIVFHAIGVFGKNPIFSKAWEEKKIKQYMEKDKKQWK